MEGDTGQKNTNAVMTPVAIVIAGALIAGAVYLAGTRPPSTSTVASVASSQEEQSKEELQSIREELRATEKDHIRGSLDAPIIIVEYSDFDCPFCKSFHVTMRKVMEAYGEKVAWVYRHFPIASLHPNAFEKARTAECAARAGGNDAFWLFADALFSDNNTIDNALSKAGINKEEITPCLTDKKIDERINQSIQDVGNAGGRGAPFSLIFGPDNTILEVPGAVEFENLKPVLDSMLAS